MPRFPHAAIAKRLLEGDQARTTEEKGAALEDVVVQSFCRVTGVSLLFRDQTNHPHSAEIDILLSNQRHPQGLPFLSDYLMFECKNWGVAANSATVEGFVEKIRHSRLDTGILVAANGVTGDPGERTAANDIIRRAFDRDNIKLLVVTRAEIEALRSTRHVIELMRVKFGQRIMGLSGL
jgi:hypothetical protein